MSSTNVSSNPLQSLPLDKNSIFVDYRKNCGLTASAVARLSDADSPFPWEAMIALLRSAGATQFQNATGGQIVDWINAYNKTKLAAQMTLDSFSGVWNETTGRQETYCVKEICRQLGWQGNTDLSGIGVLSSYIVQVALATIFALAFAAFYIHDRRRPQPIDHRVLSNTKPTTRVALSASVGVFWDSALLFTVNVCVAALVVSTTEKRKYTMYFSALTALVTVWTVLLMWPFYSPSCTGSKLVRVAGLTAASVLAVILSRLPFYPAASKQGSAFGERCIPLLVLTLRGYDLVILPSLYGIPISLLHLWACYLIPRIKGGRVLAYLQSDGLPWPLKFGRSAARMLSILCRIMAFWLMWLSISLFIVARQEIARTAGESLQEGRWGFGQILALATWVPTIVDFVAVLNGNPSWIQGRLPRPSPAHRNPESEQQGEVVNGLTISEHGSLMPLTHIPTREGSDSRSQL